MHNLDADGSRPLHCPHDVTIRLPHFLELTLGKILGEGAFCHVKEISAINLNSRENDEGSSPTELSSEHKGETDEADFPINLFNNEADLREYMSDNCLREDGEGLHARYALKQLKSTNSQKHVEQGLLDLSIEAEFLSRINHPNVIKMRGLTGKPLSPNFGLVLDRLYMTLEDRMDMWTEIKKNSMSSGLCGCLGLGSLDEGTKANILISVVTIAYDLACGMRYLHEQNILYRDTKPENAGFDVRGDIKIFDFGFSKELSKDLFDKTSRQYNLTKRTGSQPYLAPENFTGKPYGKPSDVFSFGILLWEMLHSKFAVSRSVRRYIHSWIAPNLICIHFFHICIWCKVLSFARSTRLQRCRLRTELAAKH